MNSYNAHFSFAGTLLAASDKPMTSSPPSCTESMVISPNHLYKRSREQTYRGVRTTLPDHWILLYSYHFTMSQCIIVLYLHRRLL